MDMALPWVRKLSDISRWGLRGSLDEVMLLAAARVNDSRSVASQVFQAPTIGEVLSSSSRNSRSSTGFDDRDC